MRVWLAGSTGVIGWPLLQDLVAHGHEVLAQTRSESAAERIVSAGGVPFVCDAFDRDRLREVVLAWRPDGVINQLTSIPPRIDPRRVLRDLATTNRLRSDGARLLVEVAGEAGARRVVTQSVAFAYRPGATSPVDESHPLYLEAPPAFRPVIQAVRDCESATLAYAPGGTVLRYGFFYGPGTIYAPDGTFTGDVRRRRIPVVGNGGARFPFVHVSDAVSAARAALEADATGVFNVVDDEPALVSEWLPAFADALGAPRPVTVPRWIGRLGAGAYGVYMMTALPPVSNRQAKRQLGWSPTVPSWREGLLEPLTVRRQ